jgi:hypothetical protein
MIAPGVFVTVSVLPFDTNVALPDTTVPPVGFASSGAAVAAKAAPTASESTRRRGAHANGEPNRRFACGTGLLRNLTP